MPDHRIEVAKTLKAQGNASRAAGDLESAIIAYRRALEMLPDNPAALFNLGLALRETGRKTEAERCFRRLQQLVPQDAESLFHLGVLCYERADYAGAIEVLEGASQLDPANPHLVLYLGLAHARNGPAAFATAIAALRKAVALDPQLAEAHFFLGNLHALRDEREAARDCYAAAHRLDPRDPRFTEELLNASQHVCDWADFDALCAARLRDVEERPDVPTPPFGLLSIPSTPGAQLRCARNYCAQWRVEPAPVAPPPRRDGARRSERLRIGYLSSDLQENVTALLAAGLFECHDRTRFEVFAYSYGHDDGSPMRKRLVKGFEHFRDLAHMPDDALVNAFTTDRVDILVDLKGHTANARTAVLARRPAAIQVSYLGYPGTMGAPFIDYLIGDCFVTPAAHAGHYSEQLVRLPGSYQVNDGARVIPAARTRRELGLPESAFVFCSFNQPYKILPDVFALWMRVLQAAPRSVLWLLEWNPASVRNLRAAAVSRGIDPERLIFGPMLPPAQHLARIAAADLFLDTFPYNAHTTTSDALRVGLPVLTCSGDTFASRVAGSLLTAVGLPELITESLPAYEALALRLALEPAPLARLRQRLLDNRDKASLYDTGLFTRNLEAAYHEMWLTHAAGKAPRPIDLF